MLKCYELSNTPTSSTSSSSSSSRPAANQSSEDQTIEKNNTEFEQIVARYFSNLSRLVQHHICTYPRLSIKGQTSPRSCFSGVLTSLLFGSGGGGVGGGSRSTTTATMSNATGIDNKFKMNSYTDHTSSSSQYQPFSAFFGSGGGVAACGGMGTGSGVSGSSGKQRSLLSSAQSILCNRDILVCLLLKFGINLLADVKINFASILAIQDQSSNGPFYSDIAVDTNKVGYQ